MKILKPIIHALIALGAVVAAPGAAAQNDMLASQHYEVPALYNPAATGLGDLVKIRAGSRLQWVGVDNAPKSFFGVADSPFKLGKRRAGAGLTVMQESMGLFDNLQFSVSVSFKIRLLGGTLSVGLQPGLLTSKFKGSEVFIPDDDDYHQETDEAIPRTDVSGTAVDLGAGVWYERRGFAVGLSMTHLNGPKISLSNENNSGGQGSGVTSWSYGPERTLYFIAQGNIPVKNTLFEVLPSLMVMSDFTFTRAIATVRMSYKKLLYFGAGYRWNDAITATVGVNYRNFFIGYAYDWPTGALSKASSGSHEIIAGYSVKLDLGDRNRHRQKSIRLM